MACPVVEYYCTGCTRRNVCALHPYPKHRPDVVRFLQRYNACTRLGQPMWPGNMDAMPLRMWLMLTTAIATLNECEAKRQRTVDTKLAG